MGTGKSLKVEENAEAAGRSQVMRKLLACAGITGLHTKCNRRSFQVGFLFCFVCLMGWHSQLCISKSPSDSIITETGQKSSRGAGTGEGHAGETAAEFDAKVECRGRIWETQKLAEDTKWT